MAVMPLVKHFLRVTFYYKVNFIFTFGVPVASIIYSLREQLLQRPDERDTMGLILYWAGYMVVLYALLNSGPALVVLREEQFLKMFLFITGTRWKIIAARFLSQLLILCLSVIILDLICAILFSLPVLKLIGLSLLVIMICELPVYFLFLIFAVLPLRQETITPIINVLIFIFIFISLNSFTTVPVAEGLLVILNPIEYASQTGWALLDLLNGVLPLTRIFLIAAATFLYLLTGYFALKRIRILPIFRN
ncbi:hypothetical protein [Sporolactobacillus sp. THM19-2]|uniref:hypothetical protein n=1 Tax=Sporolactobacillus sp. THM19-2 TaxID=2511171 RepID=UPI00102227D3|nr:hypothetical protein [Sporolactobacillus sp. THM19-2]RYL92817.1 hypothetical protein EWH91_05850 [Sporolactobacillus sp. THM19-2]